MERSETGPGESVGEFFEKEEGNVERLYGQVGGGGKTARLDNHRRSHFQCREQLKSKPAEPHKGK